MARTKTGRHWKERAWAIYHNAPEPKPGRKRIADQLAAEYEQDATGPPSERVVGNFLVEFRSLDAAKKREYAYFAWPGSMESGLLPWEASRDLLDLLRHQPQVLIPFARAYWRACLAMPDARIDERYNVAHFLLARPEQAEALQAYLSYTPWRPKQAKKDYKKDYEKAVDAGLIQRWTPIISGVPVGGFTAVKLTGKDAQAFLEAVKAREEDDGK